MGAVPFIDIRKNTQLNVENVRSSYHPGNGAWVRMIRFFRDNNELFREHYHKRSNVESTFSSIKRKFLPYVRSKEKQSQYNEILCKVACYNASILCTAMFDLGVDLSFGGRGKL